MKETHEYLVPDYFPGFQCKIGTCRHVCCNGWPVTISMKDYFHLVSVRCSPELRGKLDIALHILPRPDEAEYALISPRYNGECPMLMEDGRCQIHAELGEDGLSQVCRLFPRGIRTQDDFECSCANSCEAVVESFLSHPEPLQFIRLPLTFTIPTYKGRENHFTTAGRSQDIRMYYIRIMQNRKRDLPERMMDMGIAMQNMEKALRNNDLSLIEALLTSSPVYFSQKAEKPSQEDLDFGMKITASMMEQVDQKSQSVREYGEAALNWFAQRDNSIEGYHKAIANFEALIPNWRIVFEHLLVNHMFFEQFPFQDRPVPVSDEFLAICGIYTLLRFLSVSWAAIHPTETDFVDVCSALFRLISHTAFDRFAIKMLKQAGCTSPEQVFALIRL